MSLADSLQADSLHHLRNAEHALWVALVFLGISIALMIARAVREGRKL